MLGLWTGEGILDALVACLDDA